MKSTLNKNALRVLELSDTIIVLKDMFESGKAKFDREANTLTTENPIEGLKDNHTLALLNEYPCGAIEFIVVEKDEKGENHE